MLPGSDDSRKGSRWSPAWRWSCSVACMFGSGQTGTHFSAEIVFCGLFSSASRSWSFEIRLAVRRKVRSKSPKVLRESLVVYRQTPRRRLHKRRQCEWIEYRDIAWMIAADLEICVRTARLRPCMRLAFSTKRGVLFSVRVRHLSAAVTRTTACRWKTSKESGMPGTFHVKRDGRSRGECCLADQWYIDRRSMMAYGNL